MIMYDDIIVGSVDLFGYRTRPFGARITGYSRRTVACEKGQEVATMVKRDLFKTLAQTMLILFFGMATAMPTTVSAADEIEVDPEELLDLYDVLVPTVGWFQLTTDTGHRMTFVDLHGIFQVMDNSKLLSSSLMPPEALPFTSLAPTGLTVDLTLTADDDSAYVGIHWQNPNQTTVPLVRPGFNQVSTGTQTPIGPFWFSFASGEMTIHRHYEDGLHASFSGELWVGDRGWGEWPPWREQPNVTRAFIVGEVCAPSPEEHGKSFVLMEPDPADLPCGEPEEDEPLRVVDVKPGHQQENVDYKDPAIRVLFSDVLSSASLAGNVEVFTMSSSGEKLNVPGTARLIDANELAFVPDEPLVDGVIYEVRVRGGEDGVRSVNDGMLSGDVAWRFSTVIDVEKRFDPDDFYGVVDDDFPADGPVQSFVYQSVRDATLIPGKPTLTRIYVHWKAYDHIAADWQPTSFRAKVTVEDSHDGPIYTHIDRPYRIHRPDQFTDTDRRFARNTVNLFNWRPLQTSQGTHLTVTVEPENVYPEKNEDYIFEEQKFVGRWPHPPKHLVFDYFTLPLGEWADGMSPGDERLARQISRATETHLVQLFPIGSAQGRDMGMLVSNMGDRRTVGELIEEGLVAATETLGAVGYAAVLLHSRYDLLGNPVIPHVLEQLESKATEVLKPYAESFASGAISDLRKIEAVKRMMQRIHNIHGPRTNADVLVGYIPLSYFSAGQALSSIDYDWSTYDEIPSGVDFFRRTAFMPVWPDGPYVMGVAHEIGHTYHLHHEPPSETGQEREVVAAQWQTGHYPGINGFRIAPGGAFGWNKSSRDGNAEDPSTLLSFMFPVARPHTQTFVSDKYYDSLLTTFANEALRRRSARIALPSVQLAAAAPLAVDALVRAPLTMSLSPGRQAATGVIMIAGYIHKEEPVIFIDAVRRRVEYAREIGTGPYTAVLLDENGVTLARQLFGEYVVTGFADFDDPWMYFQVYLPENDSGQRIEIWEGDTLLAAWERPDWRPEVRFVTTADGGSPGGAQLAGAQPGGAQPGGAQPAVPPVGSVPPATIDIVGSRPVTVTWEGNDDDLVYTLLYSPSGGFPWTTLAADTVDTSFVIDPTRLAPGGNPTLRLIAGNGFDEAEAMAAVRIRRDLEPVWLQPMAAGTADSSAVTVPGLVDPMFDVEVTFATDLDVASLEGRMRLNDAADQELPATIEYDEIAQVLRLTPNEVLPGGTYTVTLQPGIADRYGNVLQTEATLTFEVQMAPEEGGIDSPFYPPDQSARFFDGLPPVVNARTPDALPVHPVQSPFSQSPEWDATVPVTPAEEPMDLDEYMGLWQEMATAFGFGDEMAEFLDFVGDSFQEDASLWDVVFEDEDVDDIWGMADDWFGDLDWDQVQRELDEFEAWAQAMRDAEIPRPVDVDVEDVPAPGTGALHMDGRTWSFAIMSCALPSPAAHEINIVGTGIVEGTGQAFDITITQLDMGFGAQGFMTSVVVEAESDTLMVTAMGPDDTSATLAQTGDGVVRGEGTITSFITFQQYAYVLAAHCP